MRDTITFRGKEYRVEVDMCVLDQYLRAVGSNRISEVEAAMPMDIMLLVYLSMSEGAELDGVELDLEPKDLKRLRKPEYETLLEEFMPIFRRQVTPDLGEDDGKDKKKVTTDRP